MRKRKNLNVAVGDFRLQARTLTQGRLGWVETAIRTYTWEANSVKSLIKHKREIINPNFCI